MIRVILIVLEVLIGVAALGGGLNAMLGARGVPREWLQGSPFKTYLIPGLFLFLVVGGSMLVAAGLLLAESSAARLMSVEAGIVLVAWIVAQVSIIGRRHWMQPLSAVLGFAVVMLALVLPWPG